MRGILFAFLILLIGCTQVTGPSLSYSIAQCTNDLTRAAVIGTSFALKWNGPELIIHQNQSYVCCSNVTIRMESTGKTMKIYEENVGEMCRCVCPFQANMTVKDASGYDRIEIYGIKYKDVQDYSLLYNASLT